MDKTNCKTEIDAINAELDFEAHTYTVTMDTSMGVMNFEVFPDIAPKHAANFVGLSQSGFYDGLTFHRIIPGFVIQGGCPVGNGTGSPGYNVDAEFSDKPHEIGVLSMARAQDPNSAGSQFFVCLDSVSYLDGQYTVFGKTKDEESIETLKKIAASERDGSDKPLEDVVIKSATVTF